MAMRPAAGRRPATPIGRQAVGVQPVYVDFKPASEWKQEKEADIVLIYLPGFLKQNLKVSTEGQNVVRARGERLDAGNRWSRFQEDYKVPERCDIRSIRARFEAGVLTITMPWNKDWIQHQSDQLPNADVIQHQSDQLPNADVIQHQSDQLPNADVIQHQSDQLPNADVIPPKPSPSPVPGAQNQPTIPPQDLNKQTPQEPERIRAEKEAIRQMPLLTTAPEKQIVDTSGEKERLTPTSRIDNDAKGESVGNTETSGPEDRKNKDVVQSENPKDEKTKMGTPATVSTSIDDHGMRNYKDAVKSLAELKEERQLLVNVGAAVLVIVALGTYIITSRLGSGDDN